MSFVPICCKDSRFILYYEVVNVRFCHSFHGEQTDCILFIALTKTNPIDIWLKLVREDAWSAVLNRVNSRSNSVTLHTLNIWTKHLESVLLSGLLPQQLLQSRVFFERRACKPLILYFLKINMKPRFNVDLI